MTTATHSIEEKLLQAALNWLVDQGVDCLLQDEAADRTAVPERLAPMPAVSAAMPMPQAASPASAAAYLGISDARAEAVKLACGAQTLEELREALAGFDGLAVKKTATQMVFSDGNPAAHVMLVGEAPGAEEDRQGKPFVGESGQLLDKIFKCIGLDRRSEDPETSLYISNILNWRPPGNRTPAPAEVEISLPFIERHIQLVRPRVLILCGGVSAKGLLGREEGISRLRKVWHDYIPKSPEFGVCKPIPALATYHPSYLLRTPAQKKLVWSDMLEIAQKIKNM